MRHGRAQKMAERQFGHLSFPGAQHHHDFRQVGAQRKNEQSHEERSDRIFVEDKKRQPDNQVGKDDDKNYVESDENDLPRDFFLAGESDLMADEALARFVKIKYHGKIRKDHDRAGHGV